MLEAIFESYGFTIEELSPFATTYNIYTIYRRIGKLKTQFKWNRNYDLESLLRLNAVKFVAVLANGAILGSEIYDEDKLKEFINTFYITLTPEEKLDSVLEYLNTLTSFDGESVELKEPKEAEILKMYFNNLREWRFYLESAIYQGYINSAASFDSEFTTQYYNLTVSGLSRVIKINEGKTSRLCFVAMAFTNEMEKIYIGAIEPAIITCGFEPYIVNKVDVKSDTTINDAILAGIKKARFTIADFTGHRGGVYFEAGYALGRGQSVIYTCREDEMNKAHFDIRNYQHIVWSDANDLKEKLINKIEAFIKD